MYKYDFNSKKYLVLLCIVCLIFSIIIIKAFEYLPENEPVETNSQFQVNNINTEPVNEKNSKVAETNDVEKDPEKHKSGHFDFMPKAQTNETKIELEEIEAPKGALNEDIPLVAEEKKSENLSPDELALKSYTEGKKLYESGDFAKALSEFQKVIELTKDKELNAMACESIAEIYAANKRYGTALTFANKAYLLSPTPARDMLIAKIYYKSGNTENATSRMNSIMKKGF